MVWYSVPPNARTESPRHSPLLRGHNLRSANACCLKPGPSIGMLMTRLASTLFLRYTPEGAVQDLGLVAPEAQLGILPYVIGYMDGMTSLVHDGLASCNGGFQQGQCFDNEAYPADWATSRGHSGFLKFKPSNAASASEVIAEMDLLLTGGRLDDYSRVLITDEYQRAFNLSSCPVDKSAELCGRLEPGQELQRGEHIVNALGEMLCMSYDSVASHIGVDGKEVTTTAYRTRSYQQGQDYVLPLRYESSGRLAIGGDLNEKKGIHQDKWVSDDHYDHGNFNVFQSFLNGPCVKMDRVKFDLFTLHGRSDFGYANEVATCSAKSTCDPANAPPMRSAQVEAERLQTLSARAVRVAQNLLASTAAFSVTNDPASDPAISIPPPPPRPFTKKKYKALIVLFMAGGADTFNMLMPKGDCDNRNVSGQYTATRGVAALDLDTTRSISVNPGKQKVQQPCNTMVRITIPPAISVVYSCERHCDGWYHRCSCSRSRAVTLRQSRFPLKVGRKAC